MGRKDKKPKEEEVKVFEEKGSDETKLHFRKPEEEAETEAMSKKKKDEEAQSKTEMESPQNPPDTQNVEVKGEPEQSEKSETHEASGQLGIPTEKNEHGAEEPRSEANEGGNKPHQAIEDGDSPTEIFEKQTQPEARQPDQVKERPDYVPRVQGPEHHDVGGAPKGTPWSQSAIRDAGMGMGSLPDYHEVHEPWGDKAQAEQEASPVSNQTSMGRQVAQNLQAGFRDAPLSNPETGEQNPVSVNDNPRYYKGNPRQVGSKNGRAQRLAVLPQEASLTALKSGPGGLHFTRRSDKGEFVHMERRSFRNLVVRQDEAIIQSKKNLELQHYVAKKWGSRVPW